MRSSMQLIDEYYDLQIRSPKLRSHADIRSPVDIWSRSEEAFNASAANLWQHHNYKFRLLEELPNS